MARAKYIIAFFLFLSAFLFVGESYTFFLENFQNSYVQVSYYLETGDSEKQMNEYILQQAKAYNTSVFAIEKINEGAFSRSIIIYGDETVQKILKQDWDISSSTVNSFFSGKTKFSFKPFENANEKAMQSCWYVNKSQEELYTMLFPGMVKYSGVFQNDPTKSTEEMVIAGTWLIALLAILLLTAYDISYGKKEHSVRIILGADTKNLLMKKIILDVAGFSVSALLGFLLLLPFTAPEFQLKISLICFMVVLLANSLVLAFGMRIKKRTPLKAVLSNRIIGMSMALKGMVVILTIIVLSVTSALSVEGIKLYSQGNYYTLNKDRVHVTINYPYDYDKMEIRTGSSEDCPPLDAKEQLQDDFLRYSYEKLQCSLLYNQSYKKIAHQYGERYVYANIQGLEYYKDYITQWEWLCAKEGNYILISDDENQQAVMEELLSIGNLLGVSEDNLSGILSYNKGLSVIAEGRRGAEYDYTYKIKNPVIILDTHNYGKLPVYPVNYSLHKPEVLKGIIFNNSAYLMQFVSVKNKPSEIYAFAIACSGEAVNSKLMEFSIINIEEWFNGLWALQNRSLFIAIILTLLFVILEVQITILALRITYEVKSKELTIKKTLGYSSFERYRSFFILSGIICALSLSIALVLSLLFKLGVVKYLVFGSIIVLGLDWLILMVLTRKNDNLQIQKVLKGGI